MKTRTIILILSVLTGYTNNVFGNDNQYAEAMAKNIQTVYSSQSIAELQGAVNALGTNCVGRENKMGTLLLCRLR